MFKFFTSTVAKLKFEALKELKEQQKKHINPKLKNAMGLPINVKLRLFPQSYSVDAIYAGRLLSAAGFNKDKLAVPILFRGDTRAPDGDDNVFSQGFYRQIGDNLYHEPEINVRRESFDCIATSKQVRYAIGFADIRAQMAKQETSWVYMLHTPEGFDLTNEAGHKPIFNAAKLVDEVVLTGVPSSHVLAAIQFKVTKNTFLSYMDPTYKHTPDAQIKLLDLKVNPHCALAEQDPAVYASAIASFKQMYDKGVFDLQAQPENQAEVQGKLTL